MLLWAGSAKLSSLPPGLVAQAVLTPSRPTCLISLEASLQDPDVLGMLAGLILQTSKAPRLY